MKGESGSGPATAEAVRTRSTNQPGRLTVANIVPKPKSRYAPFGPWSPAVDAAERQRQLRCLAGLAAVYCGSASELVQALRDAELDPGVLPHAAAVLDCMPSLARRRMLSTFGAVTWPSKRGGAR